ncbi:MAG TPA: TonB-dependent receptor [Caulobacteraceae bacterium]|nr:TonB-dependent receptor [Caulobacteraceae bacterium]
MQNPSKRRLLALTASLLAMSLAAQARAGDAAAADGSNATSAGAEGVEVTNVIVTAERGAAATTAPTKASLDQVQPESIISHNFIERATPETGGWTTVVLIAPSVSGISSNGGGIGDYNVVQMRGFHDGQFNVTYDGIAFGDTNDPTHHGADYFPSSTIGAAVVDRGPGAAGDLGQENYGGAIHFFSPTVSDTMGIVQKATYGSFNTLASVTTLNTGTQALLGGGKLLLNFDERTSNGELSLSGGSQYNQMAKFILPIGDKLVLTLYGAHEWTRFNFEDSSGPGETWQQVQLYGKNFFLTNIPTDEHYTGYNYERKQTDFEYADLKYQATSSLSAEDQLYTYYYSNKTLSTNDLTGLVGGPNTSPPMAKGANPNDIGGYTKLNQYRVEGNIVRINQDWSWGTLKIGGLVEGSDTKRDNEFLDFTTGQTPDNKFTPPTYPFTTNDKLLESSNWFQGQIFADFNWRPTDSLTISPGIKYVSFTRDVNAAHENVGGGSKNQPLVTSNTYSSPVYFLTANYKLRPDWSVYAQYATSFLIPSLSDLYVTGANLQSLKPAKTENYQAGTVFTHGDITVDADVYRIKGSNIELPCNIPNTTPGLPPFASFCNIGSAEYSGFEGEGAYAFDFGLTLFVNGSLNSSKTLGATAGEVPNAPEWTDAAGAIYTHGPWQASLTYKQVGSYVEYNPITGTACAGTGNVCTIRLPAYDTLNGAVGYDFGHFQMKLQGFNLLDRRQITSFTPGGNACGLYTAVDSAQCGGGRDTSIYTFQSGRELSVTLIAKF